MVQFGESTARRVDSVTRRVATLVVGIVVCGTLPRGVVTCRAEVPAKGNRFLSV